MFEEIHLQKMIKWFGEGESPCSDEWSGRHGRAQPNAENCGTSSTSPPSSPHYLWK